MAQKIIFCFLILIHTGFAMAQTGITGMVLDDDDGSGLAAAHIIIKGTYKGTIANEDGGFSLKIDAFPVTLIARFIGFETREITLNTPPDEEVIIRLKPSVLQMEELVVTGEDPAISIMKEVIRRKKIWRAALMTYEAEAYSRQTLLNDTTIVTITESVSEIFWDKFKGPREVLISKRQTANISAADNFAGVSYLPDFYDDKLDIAGFEILGITDESALKYYTFKLLDFSSLDGKAVFRIQVIPKRPLQPLFEGIIYVLDEDYVLLSVSLKPNQVVVFPPPVQDFNLTYEQQFSNFGGDYWLPVDVRIEGLVEVGVVGLRFPPIGFKQMSKISNYKVNVDLPDSLYSNSMRRISVDSLKVEKSDSVFSEKVDVVPLTEKEQVAYRDLDSTATLEKAFEPEGFLARFIKMSVENESGGGSNGSSQSSSSTKANSAVSRIRQIFTPIGRFNKVDVFNVGLKAQSRFAGNRLIPEARLAYSMGYEEWSHGASVLWYPGSKSRRFRTKLGYHFDTAPSGISDIYGMTLPGIMPLLGFDDYYNYYRREYGFLDLIYTTPKNRITYNLGYTYEKHRSINFKTSYDILGRNNIQPMNPRIEDGYLSSVKLTLSRGDQDNLYGVVEQQGYSFEAEQSLKLLGSDWNYSRFKINVYKRFNTFYKRRLFSNTLDLRFNAGTYLGDLPPQKFGLLDASFGYFTPFGAFKTKRYIPYQGASFAGLYAEHNFRSVPFEMLGWRSAPKTGLSVIAFGGVGKTWTPHLDSVMYNIAGTPGTHIEVGGSLSNIFNLFRIDLAFRLDKPGFYPGISLARIF